MLRNKDALICDFAETYHVLDWRGLSLRLVSSLAVGLRDDSRSKMALTGAKVRHDLLLEAMAVDYLALLWWSKTKDAETNSNRPASILLQLMGEKKTEKPVMSFKSAEDFTRKFKEITEGDK